MQHLREIGHECVMPHALLVAPSVYMLLPRDSETAEIGCLSLQSPIKSDLGKPSADWNLQHSIAFIQN